MISVDNNNFLTKNSMFCLYFYFLSVSSSLDQPRATRRRVFSVARSEALYLFHTNSHSGSLPSATPVQYVVDLRLGDTTLKKIDLYWVKYYGHPY